MSPDANCALQVFLPLALSAYGRDVDVNPPEGWNFTSLIQPDNFGFVVSRPGETFIAFRGTETLNEWFEDFDFFAAKNRFGEGTVHHGFQQAYERLRPSVLEAPKQRELWITGHSLGAALATICAGDLARAGWKVTLCVFASPRVGLKDFAHWFNRTIPQSCRVANLWDPVTHAPSFIHGYQHCGHELLVNGGFTTKLGVAHSLDSYRKGLEKIQT